MILRKNIKKLKMILQKIFEKLKKNILPKNF